MKKFRRYSTAILASVIADTLLFGGGCLGAESISKVKVPAKFIFAGSMFLGAVDSAYRVYKIHKKEEKRVKYETELHYINISDINHIVIDLDIRDKNGEKDPALNLQAAKQFPPTYAEYSKSGGGLHLHYIYDGDISKLSRIFDLKKLVDWYEDLLWKLAIKEVFENPEYYWEE